MKLLHRHDEKLAEIEKLAAELEKSPVVLAFRKEREVARLAQRKEAAEKIRGLEKEQKKLVSMRDKVKGLESALAKLEVERKGILEQLGQSKMDYSQRNGSLESQMGNLRGELCQTCDPLLIEAEEFFRHKLDWLRQPGRISTQRHSMKERSIFSEKIVASISSNLDSVQSALSYCQAALAQIELMKLEPEVSVKAIEKMKAGVPDTNTFTETESERPIPGLRIPSLDSILPSGAETDYRTSVLLKRAGKIAATGAA